MFDAHCRAFFSFRFLVELTHQRAIRTPSGSIARVLTLLPFLPWMSTAIVRSVRMNEFARDANFNDINRMLIRDDITRVFGITRNI